MLQPGQSECSVSLYRAACYGDSAIQRSYESIPNTGHGFNELRLPWRIAECLPNSVDGRMQAVIEVNESVVAPKRDAELLSRNHLPSVLDQQGEHTHRLAV
jgi:hypothetical protein